MVTAGADLRAHVESELASLMAACGLRAADRADLIQQLPTLTDDDWAAIFRVVESLSAVMGQQSDHGALVDALPDQPGRPMGLLPIVAFLATTPALKQHYGELGIDSDVAAASLTELGQQIWVHRQTYKEFGLHTGEWLTKTFTGSLFWLGRLQFNLDQVELPRCGRQWVIDTHIPQSGPLTPELVDQSFAAATSFFGRYFASYDATRLHCHSWLLDPQLAHVLPPSSNMVSFQRRWQLIGEPSPGNSDALFFTFRTRSGQIDGLPRDTTLQRAILDRIRAGGQWQVWSGVVEPQPDAVVAAG